MRAENYNPHLDVLRAIAVMAVCFYHLPESEFSYGWLGVDIFFVLSGYLIIGQILRQIEEGRFSVRNFLQRRVRRILPGLLVVLATSSIVAFYLFQGVYLKNFSENLFGALIGASNFTLWKQNNYFDTANALKPLLHTWSLGLEAQFYVVIPVCLVALKYIKLDAKSFLVLATMFSLSLAAYGFYSYPSPTFFLLPTRAWEFLAGGMVFVLLRKPDISIGSQYVLNFSTLAIIGIFFAVLFSSLLDGFSIFSCILFIVFLTIISIVFFEKFKVKKTRWFQPLLYIGMISYSLYLVHFPIIAFLNHLDIVFFYNELLNNSFILLILLVTGSLLFYMVERPFRYTASLNKLYSMVVLCYSILIPISLILFQNSSDRLFLSFRDGHVEMPVEFGGAYKDGRFCSNLSIGGKPCLFRGGQLDGPVFVLLGDSHARVLSEAFYEGLSDIGGLVDLTKSGCPFLLNEQVVTVRGEFTGCDGQYQASRLQVLEELAEDHELVIVLAANLPSYLQVNRFQNSEGYVELERQVLFESTWVSQRTKEGLKNFSFASDFSESVRQLNAFGRVVLVAPAIHNGWDPIQRATVRSKNLSRADLEGVLRLNRQPGERYRRTVLNVMRASGEMLVDSAHMTCDVRFCYGYRNGDFLYTDPHHLSKLVNQFLFRGIVELINLNNEDET